MITATYQTPATPRRSFIIDSDATGHRVSLVGKDGIARLAFHNVFPTYAKAHAVVVVHYGKVVERMPSHTPAGYDAQ